MTDPDLVARLASHRTLGSAPRAQLEWLASRATFRRFAAGEVVTPMSVPVLRLVVVLSGHLSIRVDRGASPRTVMEWRGGDVTGLLPYSRLASPPGDTTAEEPTEILEVAREHFPDMAARCHELTAILVHVMLDRARRFTSSDLHDEKMLSLGRLAAGLAHELNNPASALDRNARELAAGLSELEASSLLLGSLRLSAEQLTVIERVRRPCDEHGARAALTPLERADREEAVADWLAGRGLRAELAEGLSGTPLTVRHLDDLAAALDDDALDLVLRAICSGHRARLLATEVEAALYRGQDVAIVGGANSAGQGALFFARYARAVTLLVRAPSLSPGMSRYLVDRIGATDNIHVLTGVELAEVCGDGHRERVVLRDGATGECRGLETAALFVFIGVAPRTEAFAGFVERDAKGFILTGPDVPRRGSGWPLERDPLMFETSVPGVFAAGDVRSGANRRIAAAVGEGSAAIYSVHRYLQTV